MLSNTTTCGTSAYDRRLSLVIQANDPQRIGPSLVIDTNRWHRPASNEIAIAERLLGTIELAACKFVYDRKDTPPQLGSCGRVTLCQVTNDTHKISLGFWREVDIHRRRIASIAC